jgi:hypothetical protein
MFLESPSIHEGKKPAVGRQQLHGTIDAVSGKIVQANHAGELKIR